MSSLLNRHRYTSLLWKRKAHVFKVSGFSSAMREKTWAPYNSHLERSPVFMLHYIPRHPRLIDLGLCLLISISTFHSHLCIDSIIFLTALVATMLSSVCLSVIIFRFYLYARSHSNCLSVWMFTSPTTTFPITQILLHENMALERLGSFPSVVSWLTTEPCGLSRKVPIAGART